MYKYSKKMESLYKDFLENFCVEGGTHIQTSVSSAILTNRTELNYTLWPNRDSFCWLNSAMALLLHSTNLERLFFKKKLNNCVLGDLFENFFLIMEKINLPSKACSENDIVSELKMMQERSFTFLTEKQKCKRGVFDSPIFAIQLLLKEKDEMKDLFLFHHKWHVKCENCCYEKNQQASKVFVTFTNVGNDFKLPNVAAMISCINCSANYQKRHLIYQELPPSILIHFEHGAGSGNLEEVEFQFQDCRYQLVAVILYMGNHFITLIRNGKDETWLNCDDMGKNPRKYQKLSNPIPNNLIHLMMFEKKENFDEHFCKTRCKYPLYDPNETDPVKKRAVLALIFESDSDTDQGEDSSLCIENEQLLACDDNSSVSMDKTNNEVPSLNEPSSDSFVLQSQKNETVNLEETNYSTCNERPKRIIKKNQLDYYCYPDQIKGQWAVLLRKEAKLCKERKNMRNARNARCIARNVAQDLENPNDIQIFRSHKNYSKRVCNSATQGEKEERKESNKSDTAVNSTSNSIDEQINFENNPEVEEHLLPKHLCETTENINLKPLEEFMLWNI